MLRSTLVPQGNLLRLLESGPVPRQPACPGILDTGIVLQLVSLVTGGNDALTLLTHDIGDIWQLGTVLTRHLAQSWLLASTT